MAIFKKILPTPSHLHPLQVENCGSNLRLVVDEDDNGKFRLERVKLSKIQQSLQTLVNNVLYVRHLQVKG